MIAEHSNTGESAFKSLTSSQQDLLHPIYINQFLTAIAVELYPEINPTVFVVEEH